MKKSFSVKLLSILMVLSVCFGLVICPSVAARADGDGSFSFNSSVLNVVSGKTGTIKVKGSYSNLTWKSSDTKIAIVDGKGKVTAKQAGSATISASSDGQTAKCKVQVLYKDVTQSKDFWFEPTNYLTNKGVVKGYANQTEFRPSNKCTRAQMVTFIWRLAGEPKPKSTKCKFSDVKSKDYFYTACIWGNEKGIVEGYKDGTFGPQIVCARKHAVTFLWRLAGKPSPKSSKNKFKDVKKSDYFYNATLWASEKKVLAGYSDGTFKPNGDCLRRQMVTFLYKFDKNVGTKTNNKKEIINVMSFNDELPSFVRAYMKAHPDMAEKYQIKTNSVFSDGGAYQAALDVALSVGGESAPDIYVAESDYVLKYTKGPGSQYAATYKDLGIDVKSAVSKAKIAQYTIDIGTRPSDGQVVALGYQATGGAFIYRRSIAKKVFGTDNPNTIASKVGPGWDKFLEAAGTLKSNGYVICSGIYDVWNAVKGGSSKSWLDKNGNLIIDSDRMAYLDLAKKLVDYGYTNDTSAWTEDWYRDMAGNGAKECFGFLGPAWLINSVMSDNCGSWEENGNKKVLNKSIGTYGDWAVCKSPVGFFWGGTYVMANKSTKKAKVVGEIIKYITLDTSKAGLQYAWANGKIGANGAKDTVASSVVMSKSDGKCDFLGGQNMFDVFIPANNYATSKQMTMYDNGINDCWSEAVWEYAHGNLSKSDAIIEFKAIVYDRLGIKAA